MFTLVPHSETHTLKDAGHACYMDQPQQFHQIMFAFAKTVFGAWEERRHYAMETIHSELCDPMWVNEALRGECWLTLSKFATFIRLNCTFDALFGCFRIDLFCKLGFSIDRNSKHYIYICHILLIGNVHTFSNLTSPSKCLIYSRWVTYGARCCKVNKHLGRYGQIKEVHPGGVTGVINPYRNRTV